MFAGESLDKAWLKTTTKYLLEKSINFLKSEIWSSTSSTICCSWLSALRLPSGHSASLTWFVSCSFMLSSIANPFNSFSMRSKSPYWKSSAANGLFSEVTEPYFNLWAELIGPNEPLHHYFAYSPSSERTNSCEFCAFISLVSSYIPSFSAIFLFDFSKSYPKPWLSGPLKLEESYGFNGKFEIFGLDSYSCTTIFVSLSSDSYGR